MRLKWKAINGIRGNRQHIWIDTNLGARQIRKAVCYGQWAIHHGYFSPHGLKITHLPTGFAVCRKTHYTQDQLRDLISRLLVVPEFRTRRANKALRQAEQIARNWSKDIKDS